MHLFGRLLTSTKSLYCIYPNLLRLGLQQRITVNTFHSDFILVQNISQSSCTTDAILWCNIVPVNFFLDRGLLSGSNSLQQCCFQTAHMHSRNASRHLHLSANILKLLMLSVRISLRGPLSKKVVETLNHSS